MHFHKFQHNWKCLPASSLPSYYCSLPDNFMNSFNTNDYEKKMEVIDCRDRACCICVYLTQNKQKQISNAYFYVAFILTNPT